MIIANLPKINLNKGDDRILKRTWKKVIVIAAVMVLLLQMIPIVSQAQDVQNGTYYLKNVATKRFLDGGASRVVDANPWHGQVDQQWDISY